MIAYTLKQDDNGQWSVCCRGAVLISGLPFESARSQAREMAHTKRLDSGSPTCVEVISAAVATHVVDETQTGARGRSATA